MTINGLGQLFLGLQLNTNNNLSTTNKYADRKEQRTANSGLAKVAVQCSADPEFSGWLIKVWFSASIPNFRDGRNRYLCQAAKRYSQWSDDRQNTMTTHLKGK